MFRRRDLGSAVAAAVAMPRLASAQAQRVLRFVPQADLPNIDPIAGTQIVVRNASYLVYDTLFGVDSRLVPRPQMVEAYDLSSDGKVWTFRLREGLRFHDGEPVLTRDAVASLRRWLARDTMGPMILSRLDAIEGIDDRSFRIRLKQPMPQLLWALGKPASAVVMPERIASLDPHRVVPEFIGSGPMMFKRDEWLAGARAVFVRSPHFRSRDEPSDWLAGGKPMAFDRIEWITMPDPSTAANALSSGEIDWWESPIVDLVPLLRRNRRIKVDIADPLGNVGTFRMNHLHPPFNDVRARRAIQLALSQEDYMRAIVGDDADLWRPMPGFFTPGTPTYTEVGGDVLKGPRRYDEAKRLLAESGYDGEPIVLLATSDVHINKAQSDVTRDLLANRLGMNVDFQSLDWGTVGQRRASKAPPSQGGWHIFHTWSAGASCLVPAGYNGLAASGDRAWFGWPSSDSVQEAIASWYAAVDDAQAREAIDRINRVSMDFVTSIPTGFFLGHTAWRDNVRGVVQAPFPQFWGVTKA
ncbi:ABC transporter substrate-binding protein [Roseomonas terrae]|uniref:ABC transporter substrate-binding protein n=1 Tax=Neoroseomonas terrae TaxID=424799 RepID=A0ABS5EIR3_9PROT|nr:ABC transporter substrate-binding protein [Neoroseomonas terrae]MBR0650840.1 ABC transporter substrate-binding protein [Neoroseomonas terrae]